MEKKRIFQFQNMIFYWWKRNKRDLPWRHTHDPYKILVSEVMLQQTQVPRVLTRYRAFIARYPTISDLAQASTADVLRVWKGMGYNRRALYLKKTAEIITMQFGGEFPDNESKLAKLPGLGTYTARALLVFAFKKDVAAVDTNIRKIITHFFFNDVDQKPARIQKVADQLVPAGRSWEWHQALMDYGAIEMPKLKIKKIHKSGGIPFKETNRYFRGRIMDMLRVGDVVEVDLQKKFHKPSEFLSSIIDGLVKDGLVKRKKGILRLPD
jgi:A/G-specific adenine glycosylase